MGGQNKQAQAQEDLANSSASGQGKLGAGLYGTLFGQPTAGGTGTTGGTVSKMMDPNSLNINSPTGPYALQYKQAEANNAVSTDQAKQAIERAAGNAGFGAGSPSGYTGFLKSQADLAGAANKGQLFSQYAGNSYQDALQNFWKATDLAGGAAQNASNQQTNTYTSLYGSQPKATTGQIIGQDVAGAGGAAAGACVCAGTPILMDDGRSLPVERLTVGMRVIGQGTELNRIVQIVKTENEPCVELTTNGGHVLRCSLSHTIARYAGGYLVAGFMEKEKPNIWQRDEKDFIVSAKLIGGQIVYKLVLDGSHTYLSSGIWSLE